MPRKKRNRRGEWVCRCRAYKFPHRMFGGRCTGKAFVAIYFEENRFGPCMRCPLNQVECEVEQGLEHVKECNGMQEHIEREELYTPRKWRRA